MYYADITQNTETQTHTLRCRHAPTQAHTDCKLSASETTHSAALTPHLRAHTTIPLTCQGSKLCAHVIPAALRMLGYKARRNERERRRVQARERSSIWVPLACDN